MAKQQDKEKRHRRVYKPKTGIDYSAVLDGVRHIVRFEGGFPDHWLIRIKQTGQEWQITPKSLETAEPE